MAEALKLGATHAITKLVTPEVTADRYGNEGVAVFATPALVGLLEQTAVGCIAAALEAGQGSVGAEVVVQHLAPTPVGMAVEARAELIEIDGRRLVFKVEAWDEQEKIATGTHTRYIINSMEKFLQRAAEKTSQRQD
jgi:predicted thioesterase